MNIELYVNKKFDILKIIKMVLKRKDWGKKYILYSTPFYDITIVMISYDFEYKRADFRIAINNKTNSNYSSNIISIYTGRDDYTPTFIDKLLHKKIINLLKEHRESIFRNEAMDLYPYLYYEDKAQSEWIELFGIEEKIDGIEQLNLSDEEINKIKSLVIEEEFDKYEKETVYDRRDAYVADNVDSDRESSILELIDEIKIELEKEEK